jgi:hypothetical protein
VLDTGTASVADATWEGNVTYTNGRHSDGAFYFDGASSLTNAGLQSLITGKVYSVTAWVQPDSTTLAGEGALFSHPNSSTGALDTRYYLPSLTLAIANYSGTSQYLTNLLDGEWQFVAIVADFNLGSCKCYINGSLVTTTVSLGTAADTAGDLNPPNGYFVIGGAYFPYSPNGGFGGAIQDFRLYQGALTGAEVLQIYNDTL